MPRNRVLSFMSQFSPREGQRSTDTSPTPSPVHDTRGKSHGGHDASSASQPAAPPHASQHQAPVAGTAGNANANADNTNAGPARDSPQMRPQRERASSRPTSMIQTFQPPLMELNSETLPELQPIFAYLNSHGNKLYQEGYFLKLDDQNTHGKPNADRTWTECFAQLVGTILSLWDASELDNAGRDGEVLPKFINLTDASIKMIESLPTRSNDDQPLQNVLSISTAAQNRYLLHFNSHHSLIQWTAGIRLAMFEHATLQEAYTGALIAGKGKTLNNINIIMERSKLNYEDWARVRFGAGTPWRRCWCVISPPDEKESQKVQKQFNKKKSAYDRSQPPIVRGNIKFYDTKKTKKVQPIATITEAYAAFAIYPQSKPLIDASTLVKVEGTITIHSSPPSTSEGFVFVMPETHPAVSGFEMMLRWLFPVFDTFGIYGRPQRLIADTMDPRCLMFAMPKERRYGYLEILDITGLILTDGSQDWQELEWRQRMKELTAKRMVAISNDSRPGSKYGRRIGHRNSLPSRSRVSFGDGASIRSSPSITFGQSQNDGGSMAGPSRSETGPPGASTFQPPRQPGNSHSRSVSESHGIDRYQNQSPSQDTGYESAPTPPPHGPGLTSRRSGSNLRHINDMTSTPERLSSEDERLQPRDVSVNELQRQRSTTRPEPVATPPAFSHKSGTLPASKPYHSPELRRANSRMSSTTLSQLAAASAAAAAVDQSGLNEATGAQPKRGHVEGQKGVLAATVANTRDMSANSTGLTEGFVKARSNRSSAEDSLPVPILSNNSSRSNSPASQNFQRATTPLQYSMTSSDTSPGKPDKPLFDSGAASAPPPPEHASTPRSLPAPLPSNPSNTTITADLNRAQAPRLQTRQSISRKPLPSNFPANQSTATQSPITTPLTSSSGWSLTRVMDQSGFSHVLSPSHHTEFSPISDAQKRHRENSLSDASVYDDTTSTTSPDYASTRQSVEEQRLSAERPRAGVMRTVGSSSSSTEGAPPVRIGDTEYGNRNAQQSTSSSSSNHQLLPSIDFGPTVNYATAAAPATSRASPSRSPQRKPLASPTRAGGGHGGGSRSPSRMPPDAAGHARGQSSEGDTGRSIAWQPGMGSGGGGGGGQRALSPEQFVQQRAITPTTPPPPPGASGAYAHQDPAKMYRRSGTPPPASNRSSDNLAAFSSAAAAAAHHARSRSADVDGGTRPASRGASTVLGGSANHNNNDIGPGGRLSAREQEHVARATGTPLVAGGVGRNSNSINGNYQQASGGGGGLVGAIETRERERRDMRQGLSNQAVQQAIAQRQQQAQQQQQQQYYGEQYGRAPQSQPMPPPQHQQQMPYRQQQQTSQQQQYAPSMQYPGQPQYASAGQRVEGRRSPAAAGSALAYGQLSGRGSPQLQQQQAYVLQQQQQQQQSQGRGWRRGQ